jgi:hypothetical protein
MSSFGSASTTSDYGGNFTVITGTGAPADVTGQVGQFYMDTAANTLYGPKRDPGAGAYYGANIRAHQLVPDGTTALSNQSMGSRMTITSTTGAHAVGLRFYKTSGGVAGSSRGLRLYLFGGTLLASTATSNETTGGWQEARLASPVSLSANAAIVVAYDWPETTNISFTSGGAVSSAPSVITYGGSQYQGAIGGYPASAGTSGLCADVILQVLTTAVWPVALISAP